MVIVVYSVLWCREAWDYSTVCCVVDDDGGLSGSLKLNWGLPILTVLIGCTSKQCVLQGTVHISNHEQLLRGWLQGLVQILNTYRLNFNSSVQPENVPHYEDLPCISITSRRSVYSTCPSIILICRVEFILRLRAGSLSNNAYHILSKRIIFPTLALQQLYYCIYCHSSFIREVHGEYHHYRQDVIQFEVKLPYVLLLGMYGAIPMFLRSYRNKDVTALHFECYLLSGSMLYCSLE